MKKVLWSLFLLPFLVFAQKQPQGVTYEAQILRVSDGDTIVIAAPYLPAPLKPQLAVRIFGIDTPEKGHMAKCQQEKKLSEQATEFVKNMIAQGRQFHVVIYGWDKFGGRVLGNIIVDGKGVKESLIENKLAREYRGGKKRSWC